MGIIREPEGVELTVLDWEMTEAERKAMSQFIAAEKKKHAIAKQKESKDSGMPNEADSEESKSV